VKYYRCANLIGEFYKIYIKLSRQTHNLESPARHV
jgi:hypothetical protein